MHQYQWGEVIDAMYPRLRGKALPILRYEIRDKHILRVELFIQKGLSEWFSVPGQVMLYKSWKDLIDLPVVKAKSESKFLQLLKRFNFRRF